MTMARPVIGREWEISTLRDAVHAIDSRGSAFVIDGEAGIGKSSLVATVLESASSGGVRVLTTAGTLAESAAPFAALHMLLHPLRDGVATLPAPQRRALDVAFGIDTGIQPSPLLAGLAALTLLSDAAATRPLLIVAEDLHWIDAPSDVERFGYKRAGVRKVIEIDGPHLVMQTHPGEVAAFITDAIAELS
jgi:pimeloyl-ACP methyl ester carboxylesterase